MKQNKLDMLIGCFVLIVLCSCANSPVNPSASPFFYVDVWPTSAPSNIGLSEDSIAVSAFCHILSDDFFAVSSIVCNNRMRLPIDTAAIRSRSFTSVWGILGPKIFDIGSGNSGDFHLSQSEAILPLTIQIATSEYGTATGEISIPDTIQIVEPVSRTTTITNALKIKWLSNADYYKVKISCIDFRTAQRMWLLTDSLSVSGYITADSVMIKKEWVTDSSAIQIEITPYNGVFPVGDFKPNMETTMGNGFIRATNRTVFRSFQVLF